VLTNSRKLDVVVGIFIVGILSFALLAQAGYSWTGTPNTLSADYLEVENINATHYYLNDVNITDELGGTWGALTATTLDTGQGAYELFAMNQDLETTDDVTFGTLDTGQGANELYDMDQNVQTTDDVSFNSVNATSDFYLGDVNITGRLGGNFTGLDAIADSLDTGQGANELYDMDQNVQTTDDVSFNSVNATSDYYLNDVNITGRLEGDWDVGLTAPYFNNTSGVYFNSGSVISCANGSWVPHGLSGDPGTTGSITLSLRGASSYNATFIYRAPTALISNDTHFQIEFTAWETDTWTQVPVTTVEATTVYWDATYEGMNFPLGIGNPFDQDLNVADNATFNSVDVSEFYLNDENRTGFLWYRDDTPSGLSDHEFSGDFIYGTAGENLAIGELTFLDSDGKYWKSDSNSSTKMYVVAMALESITADASGKLLIDGYLRDDTWSGWTVGSESPLYVGWSGGDISQTVPNTSGDQVQIIGYAIASKIIRFDPDSTTVEIN